MAVWPSTMEMLGLNLFNNCYQNKRVLITGHTGFKGSWLSMWLHEMGAKVVGLSLNPETKPNHWDLLELPIEDCRVDIRNINAVKQLFAKFDPEIVFHLAAQPLVRKSYQSPEDTWSTNVIGTVNVLEACRLTPSLKAVVVITTDKCYENHEWVWGYRENDRLGGQDPYSASKACSELVVSSYRKSFFNGQNSPLLATARAGNVIGGGDWSNDRLIPDLVRSIIEKRSMEVRYPNSTRPWQHVLESLSGYLLLGQKLILGNTNFSEAWNFGPSQKENCKVSEMLEILKGSWENLLWHYSEQTEFHESSLLHLDSAKANSQLGWHPIWNLETTLLKTTNWYKAWVENKMVLSKTQLYDYINDAYRSNAEWVEL